MHFEQIAKAVDIPIVLYNVPGRTGISLAPETVAELSKIDNIVAIKEASGSIEQSCKIFELCDITIISGDEQEGAPGDTLSIPLIVLINDKNGDVLSGKRQGKIGLFILLLKAKHHTYHLHHWLVALILFIGAPLGMTIVAFIFNKEAASATACA